MQQTAAVVVVVVVASVAFAMQEIVTLMAKFVVGPCGEWYHLHSCLHCQASAPLAAIVGVVVKRAALDHPMGKVDCWPFVVAA